MKVDVSGMRKSLAEKIEKNIKPLSTHLLPLRRSKNEQQLQENASEMATRKIQIGSAHENLRTNANIDHQANIRIITCFKLAEKCWNDYMQSNHNGQIASEYLIKLKRIDLKLNAELDKLIINGSIEQIKNVRDLLKPAIHHLQKRSKKYLEHQSEFKIISRKTEEVQHEQEEQEEEIKKEMLDLVDKFKQYAINIQDDLVSDSKVIEDIGRQQDKQLDSLQDKNRAMREIISEQRIGFFQLLAMGIIGMVAWLFGMIVIIIV